MNDLLPALECWGERREERGEKTLSPNTSLPPPHTLTQSTNPTSLQGKEQERWRGGQTLPPQRGTDCSPVSLPPCHGTRSANFLTVPSCSNNAYKERDILKVLLNESSGYRVTQNKTSTHAVFFRIPLNQAKTAFSRATTTPDPASFETRENLLSAARSLRLEKL